MIDNLPIVVAIGVTVVIVVYSIIDLWQSNIGLKRLSKIHNDMPRHSWLMMMGMHEQAQYFNAFGLGTKNHKSFMWWL